MVSDMRKLIFILSVIALAACGGNDDAVTIPSGDPSPTPRLLTVEVGENPIQDENADAPQLATRTAAATTTATLSSFSMNYENNTYTFLQNIPDYAEL